MWNTQFKSVLTLNLSDGVMPISKCSNLPVGARESFFIQVHPYLITNLKLAWNLMLIMSLLVLVIDFLQNIMNFLLDVLELFNKFGCSICLGLSMGGLFLCRCNR
jgi:hypothetical protein